MKRYYFVLANEEIYICLPNQVSRITLGQLALDLNASKVYIWINDSKFFLDV